MMKTSKLIFATMLFVLVIFCGNASANVLDGAVEWNGHYYKIFRMPMNWERANAFCKSMGGHLATAETSNENEILKQIFRDTNIQNCWLGAKRDNQKIWRWITGKMLSDYFDWATSSEPKHDDRFTVFFMTRDYKGCWFTTVPEHECEFFCEWDSAANAHESNL